MANKQLMPQARGLEVLPEGFGWDIPPRAFEQWRPNLIAAADDKQPQTISILDPIGLDPWTGEGVTSKRIAGALRAIGAENDVVVNINSPGGDLFEGMAIYNMLREHKGAVTVKVLGIAASAASIIAMAGDEIQIARAGFFMIHNSWVVVVGNRNDLREAADWIEPFDLAMADIYMARTGLEQDQVTNKMNAETWINGTAAVAEGWADDLLPADQVQEAKGNARSVAAAHRIDTLMAKTGASRTERRSLLQEFKASTLRAAQPRDGKPRATEDENGTPGAAEADAIIQSIRGINVQEIFQ